MRRLRLVGGKAANLALLHLGGFRVPDFFVVSSTLLFNPGKFQQKRFVQQLQKRIMTLCAGSRIACAVRSSAPFEDSSSFSLAGQMQSFLWLKNTNDILQAIIEVASSAGEQHLQSYLASNSNTSPRATAVIVQKMIKAEYSGVIFTSHPVTGNAHEMLLEIVQGDCENLVGGSAEPVRAIIDKNTLTFRIISKNAAPALSTFAENKALISQLATTAMQAESFFSAPQDIEWAFDGAEFWLLQSRPITTFAENQSRTVRDKNGVVWTDYFFAERFTEPVSPLGWSFLRPIIQKNAFRTPLWSLGLDEEFKSKRYLTALNGIPYVRLQIFKRLYELFPQKFISEDKRRALHLQHSFSIRRLLKRAPFIVFRLLLNYPQWFPLYNLFRWNEFDRTVDHSLTSLERQKDHSLRGNVEFIKRAQGLSDEFLGIHSWSITFADVFYSLLKYLIGLCGGDPAATDTLLSGLPGNETVRANIAISQCDPEIAGSLDRIGRAYGHRSKNLDIASKTWGEDPDLLIKMAEIIKKSPVSPLDAYSKRARARQQTEQEIRDQIKAQYFPANVLKMAGFKVILYFARHFMLLRENQRNVWHKILAKTRGACLDLADKLQAEGALKDKDDIFYLTMPDLNFIEPDHLGWIMEQVRKNKSAGFAPDADEPLHAMIPAAKDNKMPGIGVSAGIARGKTKICRSYEDVLQAQRGDIIVVASADPSWSPMFNIVAGMIMETGGVLSHASIVAREFQLPTVTSVKNATRTLQNTNILEIDGAAGVVTVIS